MPLPSARLALLSRALLVMLVCIAVQARGQSARDTVLEVTAATSETAPHVTLNWTTPGGVNVTAQRLWKRVKGSASWGTAITIGAPDTSYPDPDAVPGVAYEYSLQRTRTGTPTTVYGAIVAGYNVPLVESRGNVCLLVDNTMSVPLGPELTQLTNNLVADGWTVFRHDVPRQAIPASSTNSADWPARIAEQSAVRALVQADYNSAPTVPWALFIVGRVPVPYSGNIAPDGHGDHIGAWPTDGYYADVNGTWNDASVNSTSANDARNRNVPGDGKFDHGSFPTTLEMMTGRVDLANMTGVPTGQTEVGLLRQYLVRNHRFRRGEGQYATVERRALIDDNFGYFGGEAFSGSSWRAAIGFFGRNAGQVDTLDWFGTLGLTPVLFAYGCGGGSYTSAGGVGSSTLNFGRSDSKAVFTGLFGSYFGDWDVTNNFLRSPLAGTYDSLGLTCAWSGRGHIHYYHMALGETIGYGVRYTQNTTSSTFSGDWFQNGSTRGVQTNLMGDPTLRLHTVRPVRALVAMTSGANVEVSWQQSLDDVAGYHVYRAAAANGPFTRLTGSAASGSDPLGSPMESATFLDTAITPGATYHYQVKAVRLETTESGTYANQSLSETASITHGSATPGAPTRLTITSTGATSSILTWDDNATTETGYEVQRRDETTGAWGPIGILPANAYRFTDNAAVEGASNHYRVRALGSPSHSAFSAEVGDPNPPGLVRLAQDYTLVSESTATLLYQVLRFSGSHGAAAANWTTTDIVNSTGAFSGGGAGAVTWPHNQASPRNVSFGITSFAAPQLTKIFRFNLTGATGSTLSALTTGYVHIHDPSAQTLPSPWSSAAIGTVTQAGYAEHVDGSFGLAAVTGNISGTADSYRSIHQQLTGDCRITARIAARSIAAGTTRAGIMIRSSLTADAVMCAAVTTSATAIQRAFRTAGTADTATSQGSLALPLWLRLTRTGNNVAIEYSSNGTTWSQLGGAVALANLGASPYVSLVMASNTTTPAIYGYAQFDNVTVETMPGALGESQSFQSMSSPEASTVLLSSPTVEGWRTRHFGTSANSGVAADTADPDGDGLPNLIESVLGQSPLEASPAAVPVVGLANIGGGEYLTLTFTRDTTLTGVELRAESTSSLTGEWTQFDPLLPANQLSVQPHTPSAGLETITIKDVQPIVPGSARFIRLRVTRP